jgi:hypothetical protein
VREIIVQKEPPFLFGALKWGLVITFVGAGLVAVNYVGDLTDPIAYGFMLVCGGAGLLVYYWIAARVMRSGRG